MVSISSNNFLGQDCGEYEPVLNAGKDADELCCSDAGMSCDSCIYYDSFECKILK